MLTIEICVLSIEKNKKRRKKVSNEEDYCGKADRGGKGLQTTWFLLLIVELVSSQSLHEHYLYNL